MVRLSKSIAILLYLQEFERNEPWQTKQSIGMADK